MWDYILLFFVAKADVFNDALIAVTMVSVALAVIYSILIFEAYEENDKHICRKARKPMIQLGIVCFILAVLIPNREQLLIIVGGKLAIDIVQSEEVTETSKKIYQLLQNKLDAELKEQTK